MKSIKVCEYYSRSRSFHDDLIFQDQASGERSQDQWSSGYVIIRSSACVFSGPTNWNDLLGKLEPFERHSQYENMSMQYTNFC